MGIAGLFSLRLQYCGKDIFPGDLPWSMSAASYMHDLEKTVNLKKVRGNATLEPSPDQRDAMRGRVNTQK